MSKMNVSTKSGSGSTVASVLIPGSSDGKVAVVVSFSATSDKAGSVISALEPDGELILTDAVCAAGQKVVTVDGLTAGYTQDDIIVAVRPDGSAERVEVDTVQENVSLTVKANLVVALPLGTKLYTMAQAYSFPIGAATVTEVGDGPFGYFVGNQPTMPLLLDLDGTSACALSFVTSVYG